MSPAPSERPPPPAPGRSEILAAAIAVITESGYYRASSNAIAREAGLTWGSIQHHFGSREALMLAVLEDSVDRLVGRISRASIEGSDLRARLANLLELHIEFFSTPEYVAVLQILWNLGSDERTRAETCARQVAASDRVDHAYRELAREVGPELTGDVAELTRKLVWGLGVNLATQTITRDYDTAQRKAQHLDSLDMLVDMVVHAIDARDGHEQEEHKHG